MIFRIYPTKDTFVTNDYRYPNYLRLTGANVGGSEELDVFKRAGISGAEGSIGSSSLARIFMQFDLERLTALTASGELPSSGLAFRLRMAHKTHAGPQPSSYDLTIQPISSSWDEGRGKDIDLGDKGFANWTKRTSQLYWTSPGGDFLSSPVTSAHFDTGIEDLDVDVTAIVNGWLNGTVPNNGICVSMTASIENSLDYTDFYQKKFYSRQTDYPDRAPYIEVRANTVVRDDRMNMQWSRTGSLYLYNIVDGSFADLAASFLTVAISDASGVLLHLTASRGTSVGIYSASFALPSGTYSGSIFHDSWGSGSFAFMTGVFSFVDSGPTSGVSQAPLTARVRNMREEYTPEEAPVFEVLFRRRPHTMPVFQTASLGSIPQIVERAYYAVENDSTRQRVIPFGTGSQQETRLSYGSSGNNFKLYMSNLHAGNVYRVLFLVYENGSAQVIDGGFRFKVV